MAKGKYEDSKAENAKDRRGAKKVGVSKAAFEGSAADKKMDAKGQRAMDRKNKK
mgnify:CR=1 FL=1